MKIIIILSALLFPFLCDGQAAFVVPKTGTITTIVSKWNFSSSASSVAGYTNVFGDPTTSVTFTDGNGWTVTTVGASWAKFGGFFGGVGNGATAGSTDGNFSMAGINSNMYTSTNFSTSSYNITITNLPAGTYLIELLGAIPTPTFNNGGNSEFHVQFGTGSDNISVYAPNGTGSTGNLIGSGPGTTAVTTGSFTGTITAGQTIKIGVGNTFTGGALGYINGLIITK